VIIELAGTRLQITAFLRKALFMVNCRVQIVGITGRCLPTHVDLSTWLRNITDVIVHRVQTQIKQLVRGCQQILRSMSELRKTTLGCHSRDTEKTKRKGKGANYE
jgi:hypothetical protein